MTTAPAAIHQNRPAMRSAPIPGVFEDRHRGAEERRRRASRSCTRKAVVHAHCHHRAIFQTRGEEELLKRLGLDFELLDSGCCGMAGSFGFEKGKQYDVSIRCGERVLLPSVREAPRDSLIIANGFSCREQIAQQTDRRALHLAQVLEMAWDQGPEGPPGDLPENRLHREGPHRLSAGTAGLALLGAGLIGWLAGSLLGGTDWERRRPRRTTNSN